MREAAPATAAAPADGMPAADVAPGPLPAPVPAVSPFEAAMAAAVRFKDSYGLLVLCLLGAVFVWWYNRAPTYKPPAADKAAEYNEQRTKAVERQQRVLNDRTPEFLKQQEEDKKRHQELKRKQLEERRQREGNLLGKGTARRLGTGDAEQQTAAQHTEELPTSRQPPALAAELAEDWLH